MSTAPNVLMLGWELPPYNSGGLGTACLGLTEGLAGEGVPIRFVLPKHFADVTYDHMDVVSADGYVAPSALSTFLNREDIKKELLTHSLAYGGSVTLHKESNGLVVEQAQSPRQTPVAPHIQAAWYAEAAAAIANERDDYNVIHAHDWMTYYGGMAAREVARAKGNNAPFIAHVHATEIDRCGEHGDPRIVAIEREGLAAADHVIAVSHYTKELVHRRYNVPRSKISVVHNGIPIHKQPKQFTPTKLKAHHPLVVFIGRITFQKGPDYFVKLAHEVVKRDPSVKFVMVGSGDMEAQCIELAAKLGLTKNMLFSSFLRGSDVDRAYQLADVFVMPSVSEPFGIVALEAMQNGTPAVVSKQSGVAEVTDNILSADFWDVRGMSEHILYLVQNHEAARAMAHRAAGELGHLTWANAASKLRSVYEHVIENQPSTAAPLFQPTPVLVTA